MSPVFVHVVINFLVSASERNATKVRGPTIKTTSEILSKTM